ncbi:MAG: winged helix-turn-helix domain-containing protein [Bdellovibrionota bacterium]
MAEHNWYYHLYVLWGYARICRLQRNYVQAYWYLDLLEKTTSGPGFGLLRRDILADRVKLEQDAVDLLIDSRQGIIKTRETKKISVRKQYVLLHILEVLSEAHSRQGDDMERGLSKAQIIEYVWKEKYQPEAHDNKLYYNINRLRKLIEPDVRKPQYLLNWKEGYRLAPGLKIQLVDGKHPWPVVSRANG